MEELGKNQFVVCHWCCAWKVLQQLGFCPNLMDSSYRVSQSGFLSTNQMKMLLRCSRCGTQRWTREIIHLVQVTKGIDSLWVWNWGTEVTRSPKRDTSGPHEKYDALLLSAPSKKLKKKTSTAIAHMSENFWKWLKPEPENAWRLLNSHQFWTSDTKDTTQEWLKIRTCNRKQCQTNRHYSQLKDIVSPKLYSCFFHKALGAHLLVYVVHDWQTNRHLEE